MAKTWVDLAEYIVERIASIGFKVDSTRDYSDVYSALEKTVFLREENAPKVVLEMAYDDQEAEVAARLYVGGVDIPLPFNAVGAIDGTQEEFNELRKKTHDWAVERNYAFVDNSDFGE